MVFHIRPRVVDERRAVRHFDRAIMSSRRARVGGNEAVEIEDVGGHRIDIVVAQRLRRVLRHRAADIVEQGRRIRPVAADGAHRFGRRERALAADQTIADAALPFGAVAGGALLAENDAAVRDAAAAGRQVRSVAADIDVPAGDFRRRGRPSDAVALLRLRRCGDAGDSERRAVRFAIYAWRIGDLAIRSDAPGPDRVVMIEMNCRREPRASSAKVGCT